MTKSLNDLYREGKIPDRSAQIRSSFTETSNDYDSGRFHGPQPRQRKGYWVGFWLGVILQIIPGALIAWAIQSSLDKDRYVGRYVAGAIQGWLLLVCLGALAVLAFFVISMRM